MKDRKGSDNLYNISTHIHIYKEPCSFLLLFLMPYVESPITVLSSVVLEEHIPTEVALRHQIEIGSVNTLLID